MVENGSAGLPSSRGAPKCDATECEAPECEATECEVVECEVVGARDLSTTQTRGLEAPTITASGSGNATCTVPDKDDFGSVSFIGFDENL